MMGEIEKHKQTLPEEIEKLAEFVIYNSARLKGIMAGLAAVQRKRMPKEQWDCLNEQARAMQEEQLDAEVKLGEYFAGITDDGRGRPKKNSPDSGLISKERTLSKLGFTKQQASRMETLARHKDVVEAVKAEAREEQDIPTRTAVLKAVVEKEREVKKEKIKETEKLPNTKYRIVYADPPWSYSNEQSSGKIQRTVLESHYPSMSADAIADLPIADITLADSVLFMWVTSPKLFDDGGVQKILDAWGFKYKTSMVWDKVKHNVGHYVSVRHEILLICTRGSCTPDVKELVDSVYTEERTEHSKKPDYFRDLIDKLYPHGKRIELFARERAKGWDAWGNQHD
jgi:N6-adenosine-specific RNA methylase IME4